MCYTYASASNGGLKTLVYKAANNKDSPGNCNITHGWGDDAQWKAGEFMAYDTGTPAEKMCYTYAGGGPDGFRTLVYPASKTGGKCPDEAGATQTMGWGLDDQNIGKGGYFYNKSTGTGPEMCYTYNNAGGNTMRTLVTPKSTNNTCDYSSSGWGYTAGNVGSGGSFKSA